MMVDIPLPPTITKYTFTVYPDGQGKAVVHPGFYGSDITLSVWTETSPRRLVMVDASYDTNGQLILQFPVLDPTGPLSAYRVVVMG